MHTTQATTSHQSATGGAAAPASLPSPRRSLFMSHSLLGTLSNVHQRRDGLTQGLGVAQWRPPRVAPAGEMPRSC
ncbi:hypothetical protein E2C01_066474 [Portunus trituberculatus]|uniref:Uncharacterized protein n=1 Tax=Portunus trituberculatus TaxID=210409 RepID=A0A5B7HR13_PORTR|nr:hypothetical protein [Portunus trituberculatus]